MNDLEKRIYDVAVKLAEPLGLIIEEVEYVKESGVKILRVIADKEGGLELDDSTQLNELISAKLDELDPIEEEYYLEVCSPGIEKVLKTKEAVSQHIGEYIYIKTIEPIQKQKEWFGTLLSFDNNIVKMKAKHRQNYKELEIQYEKIAIIRTAIEF